MNYAFHFGIVLQKLPCPGLLGGILLTLRVMAISVVVGFLIGPFVAGLRRSKRRPFTMPATA